MCLLHLRIINGLQALVAPGLPHLLLCSRVHFIVFVYSLLLISCELKKKKNLRKVQHISWNKLCLFEFDKIDSVFFKFRLFIVSELFIFVFRCKNVKWAQSILVTHTQPNYRPREFHSPFEWPHHIAILYFILFYIIFCSSLKMQIVCFRKCLF